MSDGASPDRDRQWTAEESRTPLERVVRDPMVTAAEFAKLLGRSESSIVNRATRVSLPGRFRKSPSALRAGGMIRPCMKYRIGSAGVGQCTRSASASRTSVFRREGFKEALRRFLDDRQAQGLLVGLSGRQFFASARRYGLVDAEGRVIPEAFTEAA